MNYDRITLTLPNGKTLETTPGTPAIDILDTIWENPDEVYAVNVNNKIYSLNTGIKTDSEVSPVLNNTRQGAEIYRRTLCFATAAAMSEIDPAYKLLVGHSISYGYYYTLTDGNAIHPPLIEKLKKQLQSIIDRNLPINTTTVSYQDAVNEFTQRGLEDTVKLMKYVCPPVVQMNTLGSFSDMDFGPLLDTTGKLKTWEIRQYGNGFLLRFPTHKKPDELVPFNDQPVLYQTLEKYKKWGKQLGVTSAAALNQKVLTRKIDEFIRLSELFQQRVFADTAKAIAERGKVKLILIAGPSSSGKTTSAKKLAMHLMSIGYNPKVLSLDNYYVGRERNPIGEDGKPDYECLEALDIELLNQNLVDLFDGKEVEIPCYNFDIGERYYNGTMMQLEENDLLILEGIHGLNDKLTPLVKPQFKFKIYLAPITQLAVNEHNRFSSNDNRLIRRIIRDARYRGKSAAQTISMWDNVQKGEKLHIFPFQNNADVIINTALDYELGVLKIYAEPLLRCITPLEKEYSEACRLLRILNFFPSIDPTEVPARSILREFIGRSGFSY